MSRRPSRVPPTRTPRRRALARLIDPTQPGLTEQERLAVTVRNAATVAGRCACGGTVSTLGRDGHGVAHAGLNHEPECPAVAPELERLLERPDIVYMSVIIELAA